MTNRCLMGGDRLEAVMQGNSSAVTDWSRDVVKLMGTVRCHDIMFSPSEILFCFSSIPPFPGSCPICSYFYNVLLILLRFPSCRCFTTQFYFLTLNTETHTHTHTHTVIYVKHKDTQNITILMQRLITIQVKRETLKRVKYAFC